MIIVTKLKCKDVRLIKSLAKKKGMTLSNYIRNLVLEKIEDEYDLEAYNKALKETNRNSKTYTLNEVKEMLNI